MPSANKPKSNYNRGSHYVHNLMIHLILTTKYRRNVLKHFGAEMVEKLNDIAGQTNFSIREAHHDDNHIYIMIDYEPKISVSQIVRKIKSETQNWAWTQHENTCRLYYWKPNQRLFWHGGYFACSVGDASQERIQEYIANQGKRSAPNSSS